MAELLNPAEFHQGLEALDDWSGDRQKGIAKRFALDDFGEAMAFVNRVADIAEEMHHHPDISIRWNRVELTITSHSAGGVTQSCLDLAARVDREAAGR